MDLDKILIKLEKQGWKLEKDFLDKNQNFLQDLVDETEKAINYTRCCESDSEQLNDNKCVVCGDKTYGEPFPVCNTCDKDENLW